MNETNRNSADRHIDHGRTRTRRAVLTTLSSLGIGTTVFQRAVADEASKSDDALTLDQIKSSEWVAGIELTEEQRTALQSELEKVRKEGKTIQSLEVGYDTLPAFRFDPEMVDPDSASRNLAPRSWLKAEESQSEISSLTPLSCRGSRFDNWGVAEIKADDVCAVDGALPEAT